MPPSIPLDIVGIGVCAAGMVDWPHAEAILRGSVPYAAEPLPNLVADSLPPTERRRANGVANLALHVAGEAVAGLSPAQAAKLPTVFSSGHGDGQVLGQLLQALAQHSVALSPTLFHNSVFNAPAGYWGIAAHNQAPSVALCAGAASFAAGLVESYAQACASHSAVLYVAVDAAFPESLNGLGLHHQTFACAMLLAPNGSHSAMRRGTIESWTVSGEHRPASDVRPAAGVCLAENPIDSFFGGNPAAQALRLLSAIARRRAGDVRLPYLDATSLDIVFSA
jgi:hypothetical protein